MKKQFKTVIIPKIGTWIDDNAFVNEAMWVIEKLFPEKSREELFDELEVPRITLD